MSWVSRTFLQVLREWREKRFTGMALVHIQNGKPKLVQYGHPNEIQIAHDEPLERKDLTAGQKPGHSPTR